MQQHERRSAAVVEEIQGVARVRQTGELIAGIVIGIDRSVHRLGCAQTVGIIGKADARCAVGGCCQLPAMLPGEVPAVIIVGGVADGVILDSGTVVGCQQIAPVGITVGIGIDRSALVRCKDITRVIVLTRNIAL